MGSSSGNWNRRSFLKASAFTALALSIEGISPRQANASVNPDLFNLHQAGKTLWEEKGLYGLGGWQSFCFDNTNSRIFYLQTPKGESYATASLNGDLLLSFLHLDGSMDPAPAYMLLNGFGHGESFGIETDGGDTWVWMETRATKNSPSAPLTFGRFLCRFKWSPGDQGPYTFCDLGTPKMPGSAIFDLQPTSRSNLCAIDPVSGRLLLRYLMQDPNTGDYTIRNLALYDLSDIKANGNSTTPLYKLGQMALQPDNSTTQSGTLQGIAVFGNYAYLLSGAAKNGSDGIPCDSQTAQPTYLYYQSMVDGSSGYAATAAGLSLPYREPEGMSIQITGTDTRLMYGFISYARGSQGCATGGKTGGTKFGNLFYKDQLIAG